MSQKHLHTSHDAIVKRLKRANGHMQRVIEMIESQRSCLDIAQQLHAVEKAVQQAKKTLIHDHLDNCLGDMAHATSASPAQQLEELREIAKYL